MSCNKENKSNLAIDTPTLNEMISNYSIPTEGHIDIETNLSIDMYGMKYEGYSGLSAKIFDSTISNNMIPKGNIIIDDKVINPTNDQTYHGYNLVDDVNESFIKNLFGNRLIDFKLYESDNATLVTEFNFKTPERIFANVTTHEVSKSTWEKEKITWNADPTNKIGLVLEYRSGSDPSNHNVVFLADDGEESIKNIVGNLSGSVELTLYRGVIIVKTGSDNKKYKISCIAKSFTYVNLRN
jgi:hypothetical protein